MQRHTQLMYTSCGWFFDDISGIETVQIIAYAARVLQLAKEILGEQAAGLEPAFLARLAEAKSNEASAGDGAEIYKACVATMELGLEAGGGALRHQFGLLVVCRGDGSFLLSRAAHLLRHLHFRARAAGAGTGAHCQRHHGAAAELFLRGFALRRPEHYGCRKGLHRSRMPRHLKPLPRRPTEQVQRAVFPEVIRLLDREYGHVDYSLTSLFTDEQRRIVQLILNSTLWDIENSLTTHLRRSRQPAALSLAGGAAEAAGAHSGGGIRDQRGTAARARDRSDRHCADAVVSDRWPRPTRCRWRRPRSATLPTSG